MMLEVSRRKLVVGGLAAVASMSWPRHGQASPLTPTPQQTAGPFYPRVKPLDSDADLITVAGRGGMAKGTVTHVSGRVLDAGGRPCRGALVEIWQCDAFGRYHHPLDGGGADANFQGYGRTVAGDDGSYHFRTIRPVPYGPRTAHIHFAVEAPGLARLTTQMYVAGDPGNATDFVLRQIADPTARARVLVDLEPIGDAVPGALAGNFDIVFAGG